MNKPKITFGAIKLAAPKLAESTPAEKKDEPATSGRNKQFISF
jgi:hypothetical protein